MVAVQRRSWEYHWQRRRHHFRRGLPFCPWQPRSSKNPRQAGCHRVRAGSRAKQVQIKPFRNHSMNRTLVRAQVLCHSALAEQHASRVLAKCTVWTACRHHKGMHMPMHVTVDARFVGWDHTLSSCKQAEGTHPQYGVCCITAQMLESHVIWRRLWNLLCSTAEHRDKAALAAAA